MKDWNEEYGAPDETFAQFDRFIKSKLYRKICDDADAGDKDSLEVMEQIADMLSNVCWHLDNESDNGRVDYEINTMNKYVDSWGDFE